MSKLTETLPDGYVVGIRPSNMDDSDWETAVLDSLAAYENTGLTPDEIMNLVSELATYKHI